MEDTTFKEDILFSIVIPTYNAAQYLQKSFDSLREFYDSKMSFEIIYVNDGSTDNSLEIIERIKATKENIKVISQQNQGSSITRNNGLEIARGKFIQFIDSDDFIDCKTIIDSVYYSLENSLDANSVQLEFVNMDDIKIGEAKRHSLEYNKIMSGPEALYGFMPSSICVFIFRRKFLIDNNLRIYPNIVNMDVEFSVKMLVVATKVHFNEKIGYRYVQTENSLKRNKSLEKVKKDYKDQLLVGKLILGNIEVQGVDEKLRKRLKELSNNAVWNALYNLIVTDKRLDSKFVNECILYSKTNNLYPLKGPLSTKFQKITSIILNNKVAVKLLLKFK